MSYIRCLSNPESLYIWSEEGGRTAISHNVRPPLASPDHSKYIKGSIFYIPTYIFEHCGRQWHKDWADKVKYRGMEVEEIHVYRRSGKKVPPNRDIKHWFSDKKKYGPSDFLIRIKYKEHFVYLWRVTWHYVVQNIVGRGK